MATRKLDLKEMAIEAYYAAKSLAVESLAELKSRDRFFKYKLAILAGWVAISCSTLVVACPGGSALPDNGLGAKITVAKVLDNVSVLVENQSTSTWKDVTLTLNEQFMAASSEVPPGGRVVLEVQQFVGPGGKVPPKDIKPKSLRIACSEGKYTADLTQPAP